MEQRLAVALQRLGQADRILRDRGDDPEPFLLIYSWGPGREINHPAWNGSWPVPTAEDIDDLEDLGHLRTEPPEKGIKRRFSLTVTGREQAAVLAAPAATYAGGQAPSLPEVLDWLLETNTASPEAFDDPAQLLNRGVSSGYIVQSGREELARRIVALFDQGYLDGDLPDFDQASAEQRLELSEGVRLTMKAHDRSDESQASAQPPAIAFFGPVVAGQIAAGDITNYLSFGELLDRAEAELEKLADVDDATREEARGVLDVLRGKAMDATTQVMTGAGGLLAASIISRLIGLS